MKWLFTLSPFPTSCMLMTSFRERKCMANRVSVYPYKLVPLECMIKNFKRGYLGGFGVKLDLLWNKLALIKSKLACQGIPKSRANSKVFGVIIGNTGHLEPYIDCWQDIVCSQPHWLKPCLENCKIMMALVTAPSKCRPEPEKPILSKEPEDISLLHAPCIFCCCLYSLNLLPMKPCQRLLTHLTSLLSPKTPDSGHPGAARFNPVYSIWEMPGGPWWQLVQDLPSVNLHLVVTNPYAILSFIFAESVFISLDLKDAFFCICTLSQPIFTSQWENPENGTKSSWLGQECHKDLKILQPLLAPS